MKHLFTSFARDERGAAGAEMALVLPLMLIVMFTTFEAGNYFFTEHKIVKAVRQGARYAGRLPFASYACPATVEAAAINQIRTVTRTGSLNGTTPLISGWENADITVTMACNSATTTGIFEGNAGGAPVVTVSATADYGSLFDFLEEGEDGPIVRASAEAVVNGI
ncbi:MAG: TadE/TadG family type IV pilus assembly protein [Erythrobacter sp.]